MVNPAASVVTTQLSAVGGEIPVGGTARDAATLAGVTGAAVGSVEYRFYGSLSACETDVAAFPGTPPGGTLVSTEPVTAGTVAQSAVATFPVAGTFYWAAFYSGDPSNRAAASDCATEPLVVTPAASRVMTQLSAADGEISVGGSASDSATLDGVTGTAGGSVAYRFYGSLSACETDVAAFPGTGPSGGTLVSTVTVTGGVAPASAAHTFRRRGHLLLGRVLLRRPQRSGGGQHLRRRAAGGHGGAVGGDHAAVGYGRGDSRRRFRERLGDPGTASPARRAGRWITGSTGRCRRARPMWRRSPAPRRRAARWYRRSR